MPKYNNQTLVMSNALTVVILARSDHSIQSPIQTSHSTIFLMELQCIVQCLYAQYAIVTQLKLYFQTK
jgi:hypothetical protein